MKSTLLQATQVNGSGANLIQDAGCFQKQVELRAHRNKIHKAWLAKNKLRRKEQLRKWRLANLDKILEQERQYRERTKEKRADRHRLWVANNWERRQNYLRNYAIKNRERRRNNFRLWQAKNRERRNEYAKQWKLAHPENKAERREKNNQWRLKNRDVLQAKQREYYIRNRDRISVYAKAYFKRTYPIIRKKLIAQTTAYIRSHPEIRRKCRKNWERNHPEKYRAHNRAGSLAYKARKRGASVGDKQINSLIRQWRMEPEFVCTYCRQCFPTTKLSIDHIHPIVKGGKHTVTNICRSCGPCNSKKRDKVLK